MGAHCRAADDNYLAVTLPGPVLKKNGNGRGGGPLCLGAPRVFGMKITAPWENYYNNVRYSGTE